MHCARSIVQLQARDHPHLGGGTASMAVMPASAFDEIERKRPRVRLEFHERMATGSVRR